MREHDSYTVLDAGRRAKQLRTEIFAHSHAYYNLGQPTITDADYDKLFNELKELESRWSQVFDPNSPTVRVGSPVQSAFQKTKHEKKMLSLDNAYSAEEVTKFFKSAGNFQGNLIVEPKFDGCSLSLTYQKGHLVKAVTRGDGQTGDDVTANARVIKSIPLRLPFPISVEVRGEVYMPIPAFNSNNEALEKAGEDLFANPRNAAAGTLKQRDSRIVASRHLAFVAYSAVLPQALIKSYNEAINETAKTLATFPATHWMVLTALEGLAFYTPLLVSDTNGNRVEMTRIVHSQDTAGIDKLLHELDGLRSNLTVQTDGLVFKINDLDAQDALGDGTRSPRWATAYKYPPERKTTLLRDIIVTIGRLGTLTPNAVLEPVQLSGTTVQAASLCNQDEVQRLGINIGDTVYVEKSAEIIPKVMGLHKKGDMAGHWLMPKACPFCNSPVVKEVEKVAYRCSNKLGCPEQAIERLKHALGKAALDWDGMGEEMARFLVNDCNVTTLSGLFKFTEEQVNKTLKKAAAKKFLKERQRILADDFPLWRKIHALGVPGVGRSLSQDLCAKYDSLAAMVDNAEETKIILGSVFGKNFLAYVTENVDELATMEDLGFKFSENRDNSGPLVGKSFCITGGLVSGKREEVAARIEKAGGSFKSSVSKKVEYLVCGEGVGATKTAAAQKLGTKVITEEQLYEMLGIPMPKAADNPLAARGEV